MHRLPLIIKSHTGNLLIFILVISFANTAYGQVKLGIKAGLNYVDIAVVPSKYGDGSMKYRLGYHFGVSGSFYLSKKLSVTPELLFSDKGYRFEEERGLNSVGKGKLHLYYLNLPLMVGYNLHPKLVIQAGPELGYLITARAKRKSTTVDVDYIWDKKFDIGITAGIKYSIIEKLNVEFRYSHGFASLMDATITDENRSPVGKVHFQNRSFAIAVGYYLK